MKLPSRDMQLECDQAFHRWCAEQAVDMYQVDLRVLRYAFIHGYRAHADKASVERFETLPLPETAA